MFVLFLVYLVALFVGAVQDQDWALLPLGACSASSGAGGAGPLGAQGRNLGWALAVLVQGFGAGKGAIGFSRT